MMPLKVFRPAFLAVPLAALATVSSSITLKAVAELADLQLDTPKVDTALLTEADAVADKKPVTQQPTPSPVSEALTDPDADSANASNGKDASHLVGEAPSSKTSITTNTEPTVETATPAQQELVSPIDLESYNELIGQVTSVDQLSDVQPSDWAFQALQSLVERYGCVAGYPDGTFRGNRALTRYEFAAGLNACLDRINERLAAETSGFATQDDLRTINRLKEAFAAELAQLRGRLDSLDERVATLEADQFSTTTKLFGQVVFGIQGRNSNEADFFPVDGVTDLDDPGTNINFISNVQLSFFTQFSPNSILLTGLQAGTGSSFPSTTNNTRLAYEGNTNGDVQISDLTFRQLIGNRFAVVVGARGLNMINVFRGSNRVESAGRGPISAFAQRNPILAIGSGTGGVGFDWQISPRYSLQAVYTVSDPGNGATGGIFGSETGTNTVGVQFNATPFDPLDIAINYINSYSPFNSLGTGIGDDVLAATLTPGGQQVSLETNAVGASLSYRINPQFTLGGWFGFTSSTVPAADDGNVETINWMAYLNILDLFKEGAVAGLYVGQPPRITESDLPSGLNLPDLRQGGTGEPGEQPGTTTHVELFYRYPISDNITITPGVFVIFDPANAPDSDTIVIGALRTTFNF